MHWGRVERRSGRGNHDPRPPRLVRHGRPVRPGTLRLAVAPTIQPIQPLWQQLTPLLMSFFRIQILNDDKWTDDANLLGHDCQQVDNKFETDLDAISAIDNLVDIGFCRSNLRIAECAYPVLSKKLPQVSSREIGDVLRIDHDYLILIKQENNCFYWLIDYRWEEIPEYLFAALNRLQDEREQANG
jgi:hypothetical protein